MKVFRVKQTEISRYKVQWKFKWTPIWFDYEPTGYSYDNEFGDFDSAKKVAEYAKKKENFKVKIYEI